MLGSIPQQKSVPAGNHFIITRRIGDPSPRTAHSDQRSALGAHSYPSLKHGVSFERVAVNFRFSNRNRKSSNFIREFADLTWVRLGLRPDQSGKRNHGSSRPFVPQRRRHPCLATSVAGLGMSGEICPVETGSGDLPSMFFNHSATASTGARRQRALPASCQSGDTGFAAPVRSMRKSSLGIPSDWRFH